MKTIKNLYLICSVTALVALFSLFSCGEDNMNQTRGNSAIPAQILNPRVQNIPGGSIIYYDRPDDNNLRYVKAVYTTDDGVLMDATASFFTDSILVRGFRDACTIEVSLYSVNANEGMSAPVKVSVSPQTPSYMLAYNNLEILPTFMGVRAATTNETGDKLTIAVYKKDVETNLFEEIGMTFTDWQEINYSVKGQDTIESVYMVKIRDQWGHWSGEKQAAVTPWYEEQLNKSLFREARLCNVIEGYSGVDIPTQEGQILPSNYWGHFMHWWSGSNVRFEYLWDNEYCTNTGKCYHTRPSSVLPQHFTIDLGKAYTLSRIIIWGRVSDTEMGAGSNDTQHIFRNGMPKHIQLFGATYTGADMTQLQDDIDNPDYWVDLGHYFLRRADGSMDMITGGTTDFGTVEDRLLIQKGHEFEFPSWAPKIRYFRFRTIECYNPAVNAVMLGELSLFGTEK